MLRQCQRSNFKIIPKSSITSHQNRSEQSSHNVLLWFLSLLETKRLQAKWALSNNSNGCFLFMACNQVLAGLAGAVMQLQNSTPEEHMLQESRVYCNRVFEHSYLAKVDLPDPGAPRISTRTFPWRRSLLCCAGGWGAGRAQDFGIVAEGLRGAWLTGPWLSQGDACLGFWLGQAKGVWATGVMNAGHWFPWIRGENAGASKFQGDGT